jgi:hypothetical protein
MSRPHVRLASLAALAALCLASPAWADEASIRHAARLEVGAAGGWAGRGVAAGEAVAAVRLGELLFTITGDLAGSRSSRHPSLRSLLTAGVGLVRDLPPWEASGSAFLSANSTSYPDLLGIGRTELLASGLGLRAGLGRYLGEPEGRGRVIPWLGFSATIGFSRDTRVRILNQRQGGLVALLSVTVGAGIPLRADFFDPFAPDAPAP